MKLFILLALLSTFVFANKPTPWQLGFQAPASPPMEGIHGMHDYLMMIAIGIAVVVIILMAFIMYRFRASKNPLPANFSHNTVLEVIWTIIPVIILIVIGIPSIKLLYEIDKPQNPEMTIKAIGHQWYWSYEYPIGDGKQINFDSYMIEDKDLKPGQLRLLDVDNPIVVPTDTTVRVLITSADVLHSFAVPSLGIKRDAVPGRINESWLHITKPGFYYGQCSELCGVKHGFMPISIHAVSKQEYAQWVQSKQH